jgi:hypothetical protein
MATSPAYAATVNNGSALLGSAETNLQVPVNSSVIVTAGASGSKFEEIVVEATQTTLVATTVAGIVYIFLYDGSTYHLYDAVLVNAVTASTTVAPFRLSRVYNNLVLKTGWSIRASQSIAGNASILKVHAFGGDY